MRNTVAKLTFIVLTFNVTFISKSYGDTKRKPLFKTRPKPKVNVQLCWISLLIFLCLVGLRLLLVVYLMN